MSPKVELSAKSWWDKMAHWLDALVCEAWQWQCIKLVWQNSKLVGQPPHHLYRELRPWMSHIDCELTQILLKIRHSEVSLRNLNQVHPDCNSRHILCRRYRYLLLLAYLC